MTRLVAFVRDQYVAIAQQFGAVGIVELVRAVPADPGLAVLPDDLFVEGDFNDPLVALIGDQNMPVRQPRILPPEY